MADYIPWWAIVVVGLVFGMWSAFCVVIGSALARGGTVFPKSEGREE